MVFLSVIPMLFYKLEKEQVIEVRRKLKERATKGYGSPIKVFLLYILL